MYLNTFISLEENVGGYGKNERKPSGHVTITSPGIVKCYIQDLKESEKPYALYLVSKNKNKAIRLGLLNKLANTKQTVWKIEMKNIQGAPVNAEDIDCAILVKEGNGIANTDTIMAGYTKARYLTTSMLERELPKVAPKVKVIETDKVIEKIKSMKVLEVVEEENKVVEVEEVVEADEVVMPLEECVEIDDSVPTEEVMDTIEEEKHEDKQESVVKDTEESVQEDNYPDMLNCGFQVKDGQVNEVVIEQIKEILNDKEKKQTSKETRDEEAIDELNAFIEASEQESLGFADEPVEVFLSKDDSKTIQEALTREDKDAAYIQEIEGVLYAIKDAMHTENKA